jgi:hypothetical protein
MGTDPNNKEDGIRAPSTKVMKVMVIIIISIILIITNLL